MAIEGWRRRATANGSKQLVRAKGLEPPRLSSPEPKSGASTNFATPAHGLAAPSQGAVYSTAPARTIGKAAVFRRVDNGREYRVENGMLEITIPAQERRTGSRQIQVESSAKSGASGSGG